MSAKEKENNQLSLEDRVRDLENFYTNNKKVVNGVIGGIALIIVGFFGYRYFYIKPQQDAVAQVMFYAETEYMRDSLDLALNGDNADNPGYLYIADEYGATAQGSLAAYAAATIYMKKGEYDLAIEYFKKYDGDDVMLSVNAVGGIGDAYVELGDLDEGASYYMKAANKHDNELLTPYYLFKAGQVYEALDKNEKALNAYKRIKKDYKESEQGGSIEKDIHRLETILANN